MYAETELINFCHKGVEDVIRYKLHLIQNRYLIKDFTEYIPSETRVEFETSEFKWGVSERKITKDRLPINHYSNLYTSGILKFINIFSDKTIEVKYDFSLYVSFSYNIEAQHTEFEILNQEQNILRRYNEQIFSRVESLELFSLLNEKNTFDGEGSMVFFKSIAQNDNNLPIKFNIFEKHDDLLMCHQDILLAIAELDIYKPYISNLTMNSVRCGGKDIYQYFPNFYDKRYLTISSRIIELIYSFWDKIGALLAPYITPQIPKNRVGFAKVVDKVSEDISNKYINWIREFKKDKFVDLNNRRKVIVHYTSFEFQNFSNYFSNFSSKEKLTELQIEKEELPKYFMEHLDFAQKGFYNAVKFLATR